MWLSRSFWGCGCWCAVSGPVVVDVSSSDKNATPVLQYYCDTYFVGSGMVMPTSAQHDPRQVLPFYFYFSYNYTRCIPSGVVYLIDYPRIRAKHRLQTMADDVFKVVWLLVFAKQTGWL